MRDIIDMSKRPIKKEFEKIDENDVIFITHPGRMGDEDGSTFIVKKDIYPEYDKYLKDTIAEYSSKHEENLYEAGIIFNVWDKVLVDMANSKNINMIQGGSNE